MEVFSRFGLWRDFLNDNIQATISAFRLIKNMSFNPESVEFHQCHARPHSICSLAQYLCQDLLTIENTDSDLKVHAPHYANELLVRVRLFFQELLQKSLNTQKQYEKKFGKSVLDVDKSTDHDKPYFDFYVFMFFTAISTSKKMIFFRARAEKGIARHIDASSVVGT